MTGLGAWQVDLSNPLLNLATAIVLISLALSLRAVAKRLFHRRPLRALITMLFNLVAFSAVLILLLEPQHSQPGEQSITLLTEGADPALITSSVTSKLYITPAAASLAGSKQMPPGANWLLDVAQLNLREPALGSIKLLGFGLTDDQWLAFEQDLLIDFKPAAIHGFINMNWQRSLVAGELLHISGRYQAIDPKAVIQLRLLDPAGNTAAETRLKSGQHFSLATGMKTPGYLQYSLQAWVSGKLQSEQVVPLEVGSVAALNIMIEQSAPSFETRQLKNNIATGLHGIRVNTRISTGKTIRQMTNLPAGTATSLSPQILAGQDVLIMDGRAISGLSGMQKQWLIEATEQGLGLLILADSSLLESFDTLNTDLLKGFQLSQDIDSEIPVIPHLRTGQYPPAREPLSAKPVNLSANNADVLVDDGQGRSLVIRRATGLGYIAISLVSDSHSWLTSGNRSAWNDYWSVLLASLARQHNASTLIPQAATTFYRVGQKTGVCALTTAKDPGVSITPPQGKASFALKLTEDTLGSDRRCAYFWPQSSGWHDIQLTPGEHSQIPERKAIYVFKPDQWTAIHRTERAQATWEKMAKNTAPEQAGVTKQFSEPVNIFLLWLTLVISASLLWLERKLDIG